MPAPATPARPDQTLETTERALSIQGFVCLLANQYARRRSLQSASERREAARDYAQAGMVGAMEASRRFDPGLGHRFITFAAPHVRGRILDLLERECEHQKHIVYDSALRDDGDHDGLEEGAGAGEPFQRQAEDVQDRFDQELGRADVRKRLASALEGLARKEREVLVHVHGLGCQAEPLSALSARWDVSACVLRTRLKRAEERLKQALARAGIRSLGDVHI